MSSATSDPARLLVAENDQDQLTLLQAALEQEGYRVTTAASLSASLNALEEQLFHLVLTDLFRQTGQPFFQTIEPLLAQAVPTPVGLLTGWQVSEAAAIQAGASFLLRKPFDLDDLVRAVQHALAPRPALSQAQLIRTFFAALSQRDWTRMQQLCTPDLAVVSIKVSSAEAALHGFRNNLALLEKRLFAMPESIIEDVHVFARPDGIAARYVLCWQTRNSKVHRLAGALFFRFQDGRISQIEEVF